MVCNAAIIALLLFFSSTYSYSFIFDSKAIYHPINSLCGKINKFRSPFTFTDYISSQVSIRSEIFSVNDDVGYYHGQGKGELEFGELRRKLIDQGSIPPEDVFIILFDKDSDNEGAYTIEYPTGSGTNFLLAFENEFDADQYASNLKNKELSDLRVSPETQSVEFMALENAAEGLGVQIQFIPTGTLLSPPQKKENLNHNPQLKYTKAELDNLIGFGDDTSEDGIVIDEGISNSWE